MRAFLFTPLRIAEIGLVAALYAAVTWALAPIGYAQLQFRVSEVLKPLVIWEPHLILAFVIGNFLSNITSPFAGPWELVFMPLANLLGGVACWAIGRRIPILGATAYALVIAAAVGFMLSVLLRAPFLALFPWIAISELILIVGGVPLMRGLLRVLGAFRVKIGSLAPR